MIILNCNKQTGDVITENTARINFYGKVDSIANIYNSSRVEKDGILDGFCINGINIPKSEANEYYMALWWQFFNENEDVLERVLSFDDYKDDMPEGAVNSPARIFKFMKKYGHNGLGSNCKDFLIRLRDRKNEMSDASGGFNLIKREAEALINANFKSESKGDILDKAREKNGLDFMRVCSVIYDRKLGAITEALYNKMMKDLKREIDNKEDEFSSEEIVLG